MPLYTVIFLYTELDLEVSILTMGAEKLGKVNRLRRGFNSIFISHIMSIYMLIFSL